jgi:hypothetical protein
MRIDYEKQNKRPFWVIEIKNTGFLPEEVYGIRAQIVQKTGVLFDAIQLNKFKNKQIFRFPVPDWSFNQSSLIDVDYFDVKEGRIKRLSEYLPSVTFIPQKGLYFLYVILLLLIVVGVYIIILGGMKIQAWRLFHQKLERSKDPHALRQLILAQNQQLSLGAWADSEEGELLEQIGKRLNVLCFSTHCFSTHCFSTLSFSTLSFNFYTKATPSAEEFKTIKAMLIELYTFNYWLKH